MLSFALFAAVLGQPPDWSELPDLWRWVGILACGSAQVVLVGAKKRKFLDIPFDFRIVVAVSIGFLLSGSAHVVTGLTR